MFGFICLFYRTLIISSPWHFLQQAQVHLEKQQQQLEHLRKDMGAVNISGLIAKGRGLEAQLFVL